MEIDDRISHFVIVNFSFLGGLKNFTDYDRTPPYFKTHFTNMEIQEF